MAPTHAHGGYIASMDEPAPLHPLERALRIGLVAGILVFVAGYVFLSLVLYPPCGNVEPTRMQMMKVEEALTLYAAKHHAKFPERLEDARKYFPGNRVPTDAWGHPFVYSSPAITEDLPYILISLGDDGRLGGEHAAADFSNVDGW